MNYTYPSKWYKFSFLTCDDVTMRFVGDPGICGYALNRPVVAVGGRIYTEIVTETLFQPQPGDKEIVDDTQHYWFVQYAINVFDWLAEAVILAVLYVSSFLRQITPSFSDWLSDHQVPNF